MSLIKRLILVAIALGLGGLSGVQAKKVNLAFDFEDPTASLQWGVDWGNHFTDPAVTRSDDLSRPHNTGALKINVAYPGGGWDDVNVTMPITSLDLSRHERVEYDVYVPNPEQFTGELTLRTSLNDPWAQMDVSNLDLKKAERVMIHGQEYAKWHQTASFEALDTAASNRLTIGLIGRGSKYVGPLYIDDIRILLPQSTTLFAEAPIAFEEVSGSKYPLTVEVITPENTPIAHVNAISANGISIPMTLGEDGKYQGVWNTEAETEGYQTFTFQAVTQSQKTVSQPLSVIVRNTKTQVRIHHPVQDMTLSGSPTVWVTVNNPVHAIRHVVLKLHDLSLPMKWVEQTAEGMVYTATLDTTSLADGVYALTVAALDADDYTTTEMVDVIVNNDGPMEQFVTRKGTNFMLGEQPFYYVGWNAYDLPFKTPRTLGAPTVGVVYPKEGSPIYQKIEAGTELSFEAQVDRSMIEARRLGLTVLRTWGFNTSIDDPYAFYQKQEDGQWGFRESQFRRFDYILHSARRHGVRVIISLANYWDDYGGIREITKHLGLSNKLEFFSNPQAQQFFQDYLKHFVERVNTVNGLTYREDPAIFAWELMNEPRIDCADDDTEAKSLCDNNVKKLSQWLEAMGAYLKRLDANHMVATGGEAHGFLNWARPDEGMGTDPVSVMDQPSIDFITFHPYPNEWWANLSIEQTQQLIEGLVQDAHQHNKPIVMEEWGLNKNEPLRNREGVSVEPHAPEYKALRLEWNRMMLETFRKAGGNGSNIWMLQTNLQETNFGVTVFTPADQAEADREFTQVLQKEAEIMQSYSTREES